MNKKSDVAWSLVGVGAVILCCFLLYRQVHSVSLVQLSDRLEAISPSHWLLACGATLGAYAALAWYDRIALLHLGKTVSWWFVALCSFTAYALSHNIGASMFSGAVVRYRAYRTRGLEPEEVGAVSVFCALTFVLGAMLTGGVVLLAIPDQIRRVVPLGPWFAELWGAGMLGLVLLYMLGSWRQFKPRSWRSLRLEYPRLGIVIRQLLAGLAELLCAAAIIHFALPEAQSPGYVTVLGVFLASFCLALASHAPGGLGVLEVTFMAAMPDVPKVDVLAALIVFRCLYLLVPFALSLLLAAGFEWLQWRVRLQRV